MRIDRIISIIMLLLQRDVINAAELARIFGVTIRTIYRDAGVILKAGIPVSATPGPNGGLRIAEQYKAEKRLFTGNDIASLIINMKNAGLDFTKGSRMTALARLRGMVARERLAEMENQFSGSSGESSVVAVTIRFDESVRDEVALFCGENVDLIEESGTLTAVFDIQDNKFGYNTLFMLPDNCVCVAPERVRQYVVKKISAMKKRYGLIKKAKNKD